jgi:hypothetical protein
MQLNPKNCQNVEYCGRAWEEIVSVQAERRYDNVLVDAHIREQIDRAHEIKAGELISVETDSRSEPFFIGEAVALTSATDPCTYTIESDFEGEFGPMAKGDWVLNFNKYEPCALGSPFYTRTAKVFPVYVENIRLRNVTLLQQNSRPTRHCRGDQSQRFLLANEERDKIMRSLAEDRPDWRERPNYKE